MYDPFPWAKPIGNFEFCRFFIFNINSKDYSKSLGLVC